MASTRTSLLTPAALTARRCRAQLLTGPPAGDPVAVAERLLAVQAQDPRGFRLAIRARTTGVSVDDVERALSIDRSLVVTTLNRGTLHLVRPEDYWWLHALTTPALMTGSARRLAQVGVNREQAELGVKTIVAALGADGPLGRNELRDRLDRANVPTAGQALVHLLYLTALRGLTVRGPMQNGQQALVLVGDWLGPVPRVDREAALANLARRYLAGHGPADDRDLARWAGVTLTDARAGLSMLSGELVHVAGGLVDVPEAVAGADNAKAPAGSSSLPPPRLLGAFDPLLLGWCDRRPIVGDNRTLVTDNGIFRAFALVGGRAVGSWGVSGITLTIRPFEPLSRRTERALSQEAAEIGSYLGFQRRPEIVFDVPAP